jgi:biopolymer transport protein ExbD
MMTQPVSRLRSSLKLLSVIPVVLMLAFLFGCESTPADVGSSDKTITIAFTDSESILLNGEEIEVSTLDDRLSELSKTYELHFIIEDHPEMLAGPVMEVNRLVQRYRSMNAGKSQDLIVIDINDRSEIVIDETIHTLDELRNKLSDHAERTNLIISLRVERGAETDTILSVQSLFREIKVSRIHYSTIQKSAAAEVADTMLRQKLTDLNNAARRYMELSPESYSYDELDRKYREFLRKHDTFYEAQLRLYEDSLTTPPPPPPIVPSPESRLNNRSEANDNRAPSSSEQKDISAKEMKIFSILINAQGSLLIDEQPGSPSDVKDAVKDFVAETKELPVMAVVAIRTDRRTPYDVYLEVIREASAAYDELRDRASYERFGVPYSALAPDSEQQAEIRDIYPKRISAAEPETRNNG